MKDLQKIANECIAELNAIGIFPAQHIRWNVNTRALTRWGYCRKLDKHFYQIEISERLLRDEVPDTATKDTIIHELLHTLPGGMTHAGKWSAAAAKVNRLYPQYDIKRTASSEEKGVETVTYKYAVRCTRCGTEYARMRMVKLIQHPELYTCGACGGTMERIR